MYQRRKDLKKDKLLKRTLVFGLFVCLGGGVVCFKIKPSILSIKKEEFERKNECSAL